MMKTFLAALAAGAMLIAAGITTASADIIGPINGVWSAGDSTQDGRLFRDGTPSSGSKAFPGYFDTSPGYGYQVFEFQNLSASAQLITVTQLNTDFETFLAGYLGFYDPTNLATNYIGDGGVSGNTVFTLTIPASAVFDIVASTRIALTSELGSAFSFTVASDGPLSGPAGAAVPEPLTLSLMGAGLAGLAFARRKRGSRQ